MSTLRTRAPANRVELVCVDALAADYNALLDEFGCDECPRNRPGVGERLAEQYGLDAFHVVHIANALDHCEDPARALVEMYRVCRVGGRSGSVSIENEGERERYTGSISGTSSPPMRPCACGTPARTATCSTSSLARSGSRGATSTRIPRCACSRRPSTSEAPMPGT